MFFQLLQWTCVSFEMISYDHLTPWDPGRFKRQQKVANRFFLDGLWSQAQLLTHSLCAMESHFASVYKARNKCAKACKTTPCNTCSMNAVPFSLTCLLEHTDSRRGILWFWPIHSSQCLREDPWPQINGKCVLPEKMPVRCNWTSLPSQMLAFFSPWFLKVISFSLTVVFTS